MTDHWIGQGGGGSGRKSHHFDNKREGLALLLALSPMEQSLLLRFAGNSDVK